MHIWTDTIDTNKLPNDIKAVLSKPLNFRPTNIDSELFKSEITEMGTLFQLKIDYLWRVIKRVCEL